MLNLHFAPSLDMLVPILLKKLRTDWTDPFKPPVLMVPSPAVGKWLQLRLADTPDGGLGCVANGAMQTLERFFWSVFRPADGMRLLDAADFSQVICALLDDTLLSGPCYAPVRNYLKLQGGAIDPVKRVQLASRIARQFLEYEFNRPSVWDDAKRKWKPGIDGSWLEGKWYNGDDSEDAAWQRDLYCKAHRCLEQAGVRYLSLPHLYRRRREHGGEDGAPWLLHPGTVFLFGVSKVSHFHRNTLVEISRMPGVDMHVFLTNPCAEFWEDVDTWRNHRYPRQWRHDSPLERTGISARDSSDYEKKELEDFASLPEDPRLLELWGRAGKENIYLWCPPAEWHFEYYCPEAALQDVPLPETLLKALQKSLLRRESGLAGIPGSGAGKNDGSLQVLACPDPAREVEELREQVLDLIAEGRSNKKEQCLRLNEIAVYLPDSGAYLAQIHRVFGAFGPGDPGYIPYAVLGAPGSDSLFAQGMRILLEVIEGRFDRARVFSLLRNPLVQTTRDILPDRVAVWEGWAEALGIFRGFNREHREQMGDGGQTCTDLHTFELGIARLMLGNLAAGPTALDYTLSADGENRSLPLIPLFRDFNTSDADSVEQFSGLVEDLYNDAGKSGRLTASGAPLSESVDAMIELAQAWFGTVPEEKGGKMAAEEGVLRSFCDALKVIKLQRELALRESIEDKKEFLALVRECLPLELPPGSRAWTGGITFAPLRPAMVVPHRVIFALGLGATAFPGTNETPTWDLLSHKRIVGDSDRVRDNRFAFLELLHAAREKLVLSFRARNMQKEEDLQPSSVILEIESYLRDQGLKDAGERCLIRRNVPWIVHESLKETAEGVRPHGTWDGAEVRLALLDGGPGVKKARYRYSNSGGTEERAAQGVRRTTLAGIRRYFANPLEYHLTRTLGIEFDEPPATINATDEPLASGFLETLTLHRTIWTKVLEMVFPGDENGVRVTADALCALAETVAREVHDEHLLRAGSPEAQFGAMERRNLTAWARACAEPTLGLLSEFSNHRLLHNGDLSLERPGFNGGLDIAMKDAGMKDAGVCLVECRHRLALVPRVWKKDNSDSIGIITIKNTGKIKNSAVDNADLWVQGAIQWLAEYPVVSPDDVKAPAIKLVQLDRNNHRVDTCSIRNFEEADRNRKLLEIRRWLGMMTGEMLINGCSDHLPFKVVQELYAGDWGALTKERIEEKLLDEEHGYTSFLEAFRLVEARMPAGDVCALARARYQPMLEGWIHA